MKKIYFTMFDSLLSVADYFNTPKKCKQALTESRWGDDIVCPTAESIIVRCQRLVVFTVLFVIITSAALSVQSSRIRRFLFVSGSWLCI